MSGVASLVRRWSRRDRLAVVAIAVVTTLLVGATLLFATVGAETTAIAAQYEQRVTVAKYDDLATARGAAGPNATVLPIAAVEVNGSPAVLVGVPPANSTAEAVGLPPPPESGTVRGPTDAPEAHLIDGSAGTLTTTVAPRPESVLPPSWYVTDARTARDLGASGAVVVSTDEEPPDGADRWTPAPSGLAYFVAGTEQLLRTLWPVAVGAAVLAGVVVFSVTRMSVRDRRSTIYVLRATGAPPRRILLAFAVRAGLVATTGVALGYAFGVILPSVTVNTATVAGVPVTLSLGVTGEVARILLPVLTGLVGVGVLAGVLAAWPAVRTPPAALADGTDRDGSWATGVVPSVSLSSGDSTESVPSSSGSVLAGIRELLTPTLLDTRAVVPTTATLSVFVAVVLLVAGVTGALAPLTGDDQASIAEPDAIHPVASRVDAGYAASLRSQGIAASPEVLLFGVAEDEPYMARGANYSAFAAVSDARIVAGRAPDGPEEAVVGRDVAASLNVEVGDELVLGGIVRPRFAGVEIVGVYAAPGVLDDQVVVSLETARHLTNDGPNTANVIRVDREAFEATVDPDQRESNASQLVVTDVTAPSRVAVDQQFAIRVTVQNLGAGTAERRIEVAVGNRSFARTVTVESNARETVSVQGSVSSPGTYDVRAGDLRRQITVESAASTRIGGVPARGPPNATLLVPVRDVSGRPLANATVSVGERTARTNGEGIARLRLPATPGDYRITATAPGKEPATAPISVESGVPRVPLVNASVSPSKPTVVTRPTVTVTLRNPWNRSFARTVEITRDDGTRQVLQRSVELAPGDRAELAVRLDRAAVGAHELTVTIDGTPVRGVEYTVQGDERVVSSVATGGRYATSTGLGRSIRSVFGNLEVLLATLLVLVALATVGTVTAAFTSAIHAQRRTIGIRRAAGARPRQILAMVVGDAARLSLAGTVPALAIGVLSVDALRELGITTVFGISVAPQNPIPVLALAAVAGVGLAVCGGALATLPMIRCPPAQLFE